MAKRSVSTAGAITVAMQAVLIHREVPIYDLLGIRDYCGLNLLKFLNLEPAFYLFSAREVEVAGQNIMFAENGFHCETIDTELKRMVYRVVPTRLIIHYLEQIISAVNPVDFSLKHYMTVGALESPMELLLFK